LADIEQTVPVRQLWSTNTGRGLSRSQPNLRPYHDGQHVWVADHRGQITAVNAASGATERQFETDLMISAGPAVYDGLLLVGTFDGELVAMNAESGAIRWRARRRCGRWAGRRCAARWAPRHRGSSSRTR